MKAVVIVAHPDDETIWSGGMIMRHPEWEWTVLSLCRADDPDRAPKFKAVCKRLGAVPLISNLDDSDPLLPIDTRTEIGHRVIDAIGNESWDLCLTHGANGEYGHQRHTEVHSEVLRLVAKRAVPCQELWTFAYECDASGGECRSASWADISLDLTRDELLEKKRIIHEQYGYAENSFEFRACISPEAFQHVKTIGNGAKP